MPCSDFVTSVDVCVVCTSFPIQKSSSKQYAKLF